jgi:hypothetical protein
VRRLAIIACAFAALLPVVSAHGDSTDPATVGQWNPVMQWPLVAVHANLLSNGQVLVWDGFEAGPNSERLFDPNTLTLTPRPYARNLFCSGYAQLADGKLFIAGGHVSVNNGLKDATLWDPTTNTAQRLPDLANARWYPTVTTLSDGRVMVFSGDNIQADDSPPGNPLSFVSHTLPEVYNPNTNSYTQLTGARVDTPLYPLMFAAPDGRVFQAGPDRQTHFVTTSGTGAVVNGPLNPIEPHSAAMYVPGKIVTSGTWSDPSFENRTVTGRTTVIDLNQPNPTWRETAPMAFPRSYHTLTNLPDGSVIATGGLTSSDGYKLQNAVLPAEIWDPATETWSTMAAQANGRGYHSTALLLPDGRVLVAGGGQLPGYPVTNQTNAQIFSPPYLFKGPRPGITSAPQTVQFASKFIVGTANPDGISKVSLVRLGDDTHAFDQNQRFVPLTFRSVGGNLEVDSPANPNLAPPGYYMLFIVDQVGVPSVSTMVRLPATNEDQQPPSSPGTLSATSGLGRVDLSWGAATDDTGIQRYNVYRSTTAGFTPSPANRIGQPTGLTYADTGLTAATYYYVVKAEDPAGNLGPPSNEVQVAVAGDTTAPTVAITAPANGAALSATVAVTADASDNVGVVGVQFKLDGANLGTEDTTAPYSVTFDTRTVSNGSHTLAAVARDLGGNGATSAGVGVAVSNTAPASPGLVAAYGFDETSGSIVGDSSGNSNSGSITGAARIVAGKYGGALSFNGSSNLVSVPDSNSLDLTSGMTLEAWVKPTTLGAFKTVVLKEAPGDLSYGMYASSAYGGSGVSRPSAWIAGTDVGATTALPTGAWSHLAATYDRTSFKLYINGTQVASKAFTGAITPSTGALKIGGNSIWGEYFNGQIDEIRVYNRALSPSEIAADRDAPISGGSPPPPSDTTAPTVSLTSPGAGTTVSGSVTVAANAADNVGVVGVQFKLDGANLGTEDTASPYSTTWNTTTATNGSHTLTAVARDAAGNTTTSTSVTVTVSNSTPDLTPPTVSVTAPTSGSTISGSQALTATAADNVGVVGVQFKLDGANLGTEDTASPYSITWNTATSANGSHTLTAVARDAAANSATSASVTVTVNNPLPDTTQPDVNLTAPSEGATVNDTATVSATASDNVGVVGVQFKLDGANLGAEDTTSPYSVSWNTKAASNGGHTLTSVARDAAGNMKTSVAVNITVDNDLTAPTATITAPSAGTTVSGAAVSITADANDNVGIAGVQFKVDGVNVGAEDTTAPYGATWDTRAGANGSHTLTAVARDAAGNTATSAGTTVTVANIAAGPVAAYGFNESTGTSAADSSGSGNNGTLVNGPTHSSTSKYGLALQFDGVNDMVTVPDANSLDLTTAMSIEAWVRPTALGSWRTVVLKERPGDLVYALYAGSRFENSNTWRPSAWIGSDPVGATAALTLNAWTHLATTYDGASWKFYVNGTLVASRAFAAPIGVSTGALRIGGNNIWPEWFKGQIDEVRIYSRALSAAEVVLDRDAPIAP